MMQVIKSLVFRKRRLALLWLLAFVFTLFSFSVRAESVGMAWEVSKQGKSVTLLGSVHFADSSFYPLSKSIMSAYERSKKLVVEVDEGRMPVERVRSLLVQYGEYPPGRSIYDDLKPETIALVENLLAEFELDLEALKNQRPGRLAVTITALQAMSLGYSAEQGLDRYFIQKTRYRKPIEAIESLESQLGLLEQVASDPEVLHTSFENMQSYAQQWQLTMDAWKSGDAEALYEGTLGGALKRYPDLAPYFELLFYQRHPQMLGVIERCVDEDEACFVVVGAGHVIGPRGLLEELSNKGYSIKRL